MRFRDVISEFAMKQQQPGPSQSAGVTGSAGDAGGGDKETSLVVDSTVTTSSAAAVTTDSS